MVVDSADNVTLRWAWLPANDRLKGEPVAALKVDSGTGLLSPALDLAAGTVLEGAFVWGESALSFCDGGSTNDAMSCAGKFVLTNETVMQLHNEQSAIFHSVQGIGAAAPQPSRSLRITAGDTVSWRILYRQGMYEVYFSEGSSSASGGAGDGGAATMFFGASFNAGPQQPAGLASSVLRLEGALKASTGLAAWTMPLPSE